MEIMKCPYCQQEIPAGSKFCPECGKNLRDIPPAPVPSPVTPDNDTTPPPVKVQPVNDSTPSANNNAVPYMGTQPKGKKGLIAFLIIGVIVIIGVFLASHGSANSLFGCKHENTEVLASKTATCTAAGLTEGLKCADCGKVLKEQERIDPLGHTTETGICARCGENFGVWEIDYYIDVFGDDTSNKYVSNVGLLEGTFSNSATYKSKLIVNFIIDEEDVAFALFEYGSADNRVKNNSSRLTDEYTITMRTSDGNKVMMAGRIPPGDDRIYVASGHYETVIKALSGTGTVDFYVKSDDTPTDEYWFSVEASNFKEVYASLKNPKSTGNLSSTAPTPTSTPAPTPKPTPNPTPNPSKVPVADVTAKIQAFLSGKVDHYIVDYQDGKIVIEAQVEGLAAQFSGSLNDHFDARINMVSIYNSILDLADSMGYSNKEVLFDILSDQNADEVLLSMKDGRVVYDIAST